MAADTIYWNEKAGELVETLVKLGAEGINMCPAGNKTHVEFEISGLFKRQVVIDELDKQLDDLV